MKADNYKTKNGEEKEMYLKNIYIKAYGPIENLSYRFRYDENHNPIPLVLIGRNGCGKTLFFSNIVDMIVEAKKQLYPGGVLEVSPNKYYKMGSKDYISMTANTSVVNIQMTMGMQEIKYKDIMSRDVERAIKEREVVENAVITSADFKETGYYKEVITQGVTRNGFEKEIVLFFPFDRFYKPLWYNPENYSRIIMERDNSVGYSKTNLIKTDSLENIAEWFRHVYLCSQMISVRLPSDESLPEEIRGQSFLLPQDTKLQYQLKHILSVIKGDGAYGTRNIKRNQKGIGLQGPSISCNDISQLSAGEMALYSIALSIIKEWDVFHNDDNLELENITGCVLIDEADANLHIDFAYRALPALMKLFPKVQFVLSTHSPFLLAGLKEAYGKNIDILSLPTGNLITDLNSFSEVKTAYKVFYEETNNILHQLEDLKNEYNRIKSFTDRIIIYTEGKTDVKYLKLAFEKLEGFDEIKSRVEYYDIEHAKNTGDGELDKIFNYLQKGNDSNIKICMFDRDNTDYIFSRPFVQGNNHVYKFNIPVPSHRNENDKISIEHCLSDEEIKTCDENSRRIFLSGEFNGKGVSVDGQYLCKHILSKNPLEILDGSNTKKVYKLEGDDEINYALSKDDFVQHIINKSPGFEAFSFEGFRPILELIQEIVQNEQCGQK
ncbi:MAG: hypothetical protein J6J44_08410 [Lachnospiraceae bacterium]|nr:hypothetical protein [Lachnospiraceae bacterium]